MLHGKPVKPGDIASRLRGMVLLLRSITIRPRGNAMLLRGKMVLPPDIIVMPWIKNAQLGSKIIMPRDIVALFQSVMALLRGKVMDWPASSSDLGLNVGKLGQTGGEFKRFGRRNGPYL